MKSTQLIKDSMLGLARSLCLLALWLVGLLKKYLLCIQPAEEPEAGVLSHRLRSGISHRFTLMGLLLLACFVLLWLHVYKLQVSRHIEFDHKALKVYSRYQLLPAQRGRIYDVNANILACDLASYDILVEPKRFAKLMPELVELAVMHLKLERRQVQQRLKSALEHRFACIAIDELSAEKAIPLFKERMPGIDIQANPEAIPTTYQVLFYPQGLDKQRVDDIIERLIFYAPECRDSLNAKIQLALGKQREIPLKLNVALDDAQKFMDAVRALRIMGVRALETCSRSYPHDGQLANMLGYLDCNRVGISGIEGLFDDVMKPKSGKVERLLDRKGKPVGDGLRVITAPSNGADVYLTIMQPLQQIVEEEMLPMLEQFKPDHAYAMMLNPASGAVMAVAQFPQFNPNLRNSMLPAALPNHALYKCYEPGSIMKGLSVAIALENRSVDLDSQYYCERGSWRYGGRILRDTHSYEDMSVCDIVQKSSNIGAAKIALDMGEEALYKGLAAFGFGRATGLGFYPENEAARYFKNESPGLFRNLRSWDTLTVTRMPIGQGISATPWQMMQAWSSLANHGVMMQPYIVDKVVYPDGRQVRSVPRIKAVPLARETSQLMTKALKTVTQQGGTGTRAAVEGYEVAGKTGTAQIWVNADASKGIKGHYSNKMHFSSFVGYVPAERPAFLLMVCAENPKGPYRTGGVVCGPTFQRIAKRSLEYLQIEPDYDPEQEAETFTVEAGMASPARSGF